MAKGKRRKGLKARVWGLACAAAGVTLPCHWCGAPLTYADATADHEPPLADGGDNSRVVLACGPCNQSRGRVTSDRVTAARRRRRNRRRKRKRGRG